MPNAELSWWVETTEKCNLKCRFCYNDWRSLNSSLHEHADTGRLLDMFAEIASLSPSPTIVLSGGDVSCHPDLAEIIARSPANVRLGIVTNGEDISEDIVTALAARPVSEMQFSIHSAGADTHNYLTGGGSLERSLRTALMARDAGLTTSIVSVVTSRNIADLEPLVYLAKRIGARKLVLNPVIRAGRATFYADLELENDAVLVDRLESALAYGDKIGMPVTFGTPFGKEAANLNERFCIGIDKTGHPKFVVDTSFAVKPCANSDTVFHEFGKEGIDRQTLLRRNTAYWTDPVPAESCVCSQVA